MYELLIIILFDFMNFVAFSYQWFNLLKNKVCHIKLICNKLSNCARLYWLLNPLFLITQKRIVQHPKITFLRTRHSEDHGPVPLLEYTQSCKDPCDSMNNKTKLHYHELSHTSHMMLQAKQAEQLNWLWLLCLLWYWCHAVETFNVAFCCLKQA